MVNRCAKCETENALVQIISRAHDGNIIIYPDGRESNGYLPIVSGLCDSDGLAIAICVACGQLNGLDLVALKEHFQ
jgi:hypothetical protein